MTKVWTDKHVKWFVNTGERLKTDAGNKVEVWEFRYQNDDKVLSAWAKHFRNHYCLDTQIDYWRKGIGCSRADYLNRIKFPDKSKAPGPSIRAGDFGEILVADFLEYLRGYWVPRTRYGDKDIRNESTKGSDILGFFIKDEENISTDDTLAIFEAKAQFSGTKPNPRLQDAVDGSAKDQTRKAESLNAVKQRLYDQGEIRNAGKIERFQNDVDYPHEEAYGAVALFEERLLDVGLVKKTKTIDHPNANRLVLLVISGAHMMDLVHELYRRAADEA
jgi:hypothetical protein